MSVFAGLSDQPRDQIIALMQAFQNDPRSRKVDMGVGVYRDAGGRTPVMRAIKTAEGRLWDQQTTKSYTDLAGDAGFRDAMAGLVLGEARDARRIATLATVGGTGAIRIALELVRSAAPQARVWIPDPTWPNHSPIIRQAGLAQASYRYFDAATGAVDFGAVMADLDRVRAGDIVLLHGCCHNPTGANLSIGQWKDVARRLNDRGAVPLIDIAYQGFGDGLDDDAAPVRLVARDCPEVLVAASCSKNFGVYRDRAGVLLALAGNKAGAARIQANLTALNRLAYSFPPDHGARLVTMVLADPALRSAWQAELEAMRARMLALREGLADALRRQSGSDRFGFLGQHRGMFSRLGATPGQIDRLREDHGIYILGDGRMNIAGLHDDTIDMIARAIVDVGL